MIEGIFPPIPTPFVNDEVAIDKVKFNIGKLNSTKLAGYVVLGSNGEAVFLTNEEKVKLVESVKSEASDDKLIIAGTGSDSIKETCELTNECANAGAEFALVLTPSFYQGKMKHEAFIKYFTEVADKSKIPIIIYNVTKFTNVNIEAETVAELAEHPNIVGIKNSSENIAHLHEIVDAVPNDFSVLVGTASVLYPAFCVGAVGGIVALANIAPDECVEILKFYKTGNLDKSRLLQAKMLKPNKAVTAKFGVAGLKAAMDMLGYFGGLPRKPLSELESEERRKLKDILIKSEILTNSAD